MRNEISPPPIISNLIAKEYTQTSNPFPHPILLFCQFYHHMGDPFSDGDSSVICSSKSDGDAIAAFAAPPRTNVAQNSGWPTASRRLQSARANLPGAILFLIDGDGSWAADMGDRKNQFASGEAIREWNHKCEFSKEPNNLYNLHFYKHSGNSLILI
ncbi:uncharacterized protein LOC131009502 [Salvia miltiorrhiza]|uniref:uncharacterized protein LOC131009502 n=1 Tax=Salvia miltiorrhiza TaxID=226208 RepID=UPI0025AB89C7|nr:uncharacterized protein LOC131009502 [Salvia miltiorrhiza]XP_057792858.1 uncharacterized protein LOC131009502 [Salvia miltiorrhiza]